MKFEYEYEGNPLGDLAVDLDEVSRAGIEFQVDGKNILISATKQGWIALAKVCVELGSRDFVAGYHFHRNLKFGESEEGQAEVSFEVSAIEFSGHD